MSLRISYLLIIAVGQLSAIGVARRMLQPFLGTAALGTLVPGSSTLAAVITVDLRGAGQFTEIQAAVDEATDGDTVLVKRGEYLIAEPLTFRAKRITVRSDDGPRHTAIRMSDKPTDSRWTSVVVFNSGDGATSVLEGFTLTGGRGAGNQEAASGGGIYCVGGSFPTIVDCTITRNSARTRGGAVYCRDSSPTLTRCTITGNCADLGGGMYLSLNAYPKLMSCIVWDNAGGSIHTHGESMPQVDHSCIEGDAIWPGDGNINARPLFCGWESARVLVDDQRGLEEVLSAGFSVALSRGSPCVGTGAGGAAMGADTGMCDSPGERHLVIDLGPGTYDIEGLDLTHRVSIQGAGEDETVLQGTVLGLRSGASLARVTVTAGARGGIRVASGEAPEIVSSAIARNAGVGLYCGLGSSPVVSDSTLSGNRGTFGGGVLSAVGSTPTLIGCEITRNFAQRGGGIFVESIFPTECDDDVEHADSGAAPTLVDCRISRNWARSSGGGGFFAEGSFVNMTGCDITGNATLQRGGGVLSYGASPTLMNCTFTGNSAGLHGGGVYLWGESPSVANCLIGGNFAKKTGGGVFVARSSTVVVNCTLAGNAVSDTGGGVFCYRSPLHLRNTVVWDNLGGALWVDEESEVEVSHSCVGMQDVQDVWPGAGNINRDPRFESPGFFDFERTVTMEIGGEFLDLPDFVVDAPDDHLEPGSPCVDAGTVDGAPDVDLDGNVRPCGDGVDIGAFESGDCLPVRFLRGDCNGDAHIDLSDAVCTLTWLFAGAQRPGCLAALNSNGSGGVELSDAIHLLNFLFAAGPRPASPYPDCAASHLAADRVLGCERGAGECQ